MLASWLLTTAPAPCPCSWLCPTLIPPWLLLFELLGLLAPWLILFLQDFQPALGFNISLWSPSHHPLLQYLLSCLIFLLPLPYRFCFLDQSDWVPSPLPHLAQGHTGVGWQRDTSQMWSPTKPCPLGCSIIHPLPLAAPPAPLPLPPRPSLLPLSLSSWLWTNYFLFNNTEKTGCQVWTSQPPHSIPAILKI